MDMYADATSETLRERIIMLKSQFMPLKHSVLHTVCDDRSDVQAVQEAVVAMLASHKKTFTFMSELSQLYCQQKSLKQDPYSMRWSKCIKGPVKLRMLPQSLCVREQFTNREL